MAALCADDRLGRTWAEVLQARFNGTGELAGHAIGNLLIAGLWQELGDPVSGLDMVGQLLDVRGRVLPMSLTPLDISAQVVGLDPNRPDEEYTLTGQATIAKTRAEVLKVGLEPSEPDACPQVLEAIHASDNLVLGPGSWFTSVMPHLLVPQIVDAILESKARKSSRLMSPVLTKLMGLAQRGIWRLSPSMSHGCALTSFSLIVGLPVRTLIWNRLLAISVLKSSLTIWLCVTARPGTIH